MALPRALRIPQKPIPGIKPLITAHCSVLSVRGYSNQLPVSRMCVIVPKRLDKRTTRRNATKRFLHRKLRPFLVRSTGVDFYLYVRAIYKKEQELMWNRELVKITPTLSS